MKDSDNEDNEGTDDNEDKTSEDSPQKMKILAMMRTLGMVRTRKKMKELARATRTRTKMTMKSPAMIKIGHWRMPLTLSKMRIQTKVCVRDNAFFMATTLYRQAHGRDEDLK